MKKGIVISRFCSNCLASLIANGLSVGLMFVFSIVGLAQGNRHNDYKADQTLRSNARVNPSTLAMEFSIPLAGLPGRAGNSVPVVIDYSSKVWEFKTLSTSSNPQVPTYVLPRYSQHSAAGWSSTLNIPRIDYDQYEREIYYIEDPGGSNAVVPYTPDSPDSVPLYYVKRVRVVMPGGATVEFRKDDAVYGRGQSPSPSAADKTGTFLSVDGSRMRLEMGVPNTILYLPDGGRYLFAASAATPQNFIDRHGNQIALDETQTTDTLGRSPIVNPVPLPFAPFQILQTEQTAGTKTYSYPGIGGAGREFKLIWGQLGTVLDVGQTLRLLGGHSCGATPTPVANALFESNGFLVCGGHSLSNPVVLSEVQLPDSSAYRFKYNSYGEIARIDYPMGGYERFEYGYIPPVATSTSPYSKANRGVKFRWVSEGGAGATERMWKYEAERGDFPNPTKYLMRTTAPDLSYTEQLLHDEPDDALHPFGFSNAYVGRAYEERAYTAGNALLRRKLTEWTQTGSLTINGVAGDSSATRDLRMSREVEIVFEPTSPNEALARLSEIEYDTAGSSDIAQFSSLNVKKTKNYHYAVMPRPTAESGTLSWQTIAGYFPTGNLATVSEIDYLYDENYKARNITSLPIATRVKDASGNTRTKSEIAYDEAVYSLINSGTTSQWQDPNTIYRGNVTTTRSWTDIAANQLVETHAQYDNFGNLRKAWDAKGNVSEVEYSSTYNYAYPTKTKSAIPDPSGTTGANQAFEMTTVYDFTTGLPLSSTDANEQTSSVEYNDALLRPTKTIAPNGHQTITEYGAGTTAATRFVKVRTQVDQTNWKEGYSWYDGIGRAIKSQAVDSAGDVFTETEYDNMNRPKKATNPYRTSETKLWTESFYDDLGRVTKIKTPDNAEVLTAYSLATTGANIGTVVTVTDQAGKQRRSITNGLGQLVRIDEPDNLGNIGSVNSPVQPTNYKYSTLGKMIEVTQGVQQRHFLYDSLGRLLRVRQPEQQVNSVLNLSNGETTNTQWTAGFSYDNNGNVLTTTDAKNVTTTYAYDNLNRITTRSYSDSLTPMVTYTYDAVNVPHSKGQLTKISSIISETRYTAYNTVGRLLTSEQTTDGQIYPSSYQYNLASIMTEQTYPSGRIVKNFLENDGDLAAISSKVVNGQFKNYASNFSYTASGVIKHLQLGNGLWESAKLNSREQVTELNLGTSPTDGSKWQLKYDYGEFDANGNIDATKNSGNIAKQTISFSGLAQPFVQTYKYDSLDRITEAKETNNGNQTWKQTFGYDRYGNRTGFTQNIGGQEMLINNLTLPQIDPNTNRFQTGQGYQFDLDGNLIQDATGRQFTFNGDNKQTEVKDASNNVVGQYLYDGNGKRVKKITNTETVIFVYDGTGKLVAEYSTAAPVPNPTVNYTATDPLGSPRVITNKQGEIVSRRDFLPFGEQLAPDTTYRTANLKYTNGDNIRQKFTGYIRDEESGLDFAEARYYNNAHGRFTAVDPLLASGKSANPQTFNRYAYTMNRPLILTDSTGLQSGKKPNKDDETIRVDTQLSRNAPKILAGSVNVNYLNRTETGEVPVGGKVEITYKYRINKPDEGQNPADAGKISGVERDRTTIKEGKVVERDTEAQPSGGTFAALEGLKPVGEPVVNVVGVKNDEVEVTKTETFEVTGYKGMRPNDDGGINFQITVTDPRAPVTSTSDRKAVLKAGSQPNPAIFTTRRNDSRAGVQSDDRKEIEIRNTTGRTIP